MIIEASTTIDYASYRKFFLFSFTQGKRPSWHAPVLIGLSPVLAIAFLVLYIKDTTDVINLVGFIMMLGITLVLAGILTIMPRRYYLSIEDQLMKPNYYRFLEDRIEVRTDEPGDLPAEYPYEKIENAHELGDFFYINLGPGQICIIGYSDFTAGTAEDLHKLLAEKVGDRFFAHRKAH